MPGIRPYVLSIAGYDPCGGAGVLADVKTFEQCQVSGLAVSTAMTLQTEGRFLSLEWRDQKTVLNEVQTLLENYEVKAVKFGMASSFATTIQTIKLIRSRIKNCFIIVDPVVSSGTGEKILAVDYKEFLELLDHSDLITPNFDEMTQLSGMPSMEAAEKLSKNCAIMLKGGHNPEDRGSDYLFINGKHTRYSAGVETVYPKHGSGCVYSAAVCAFIAQGLPVEEACRRAKKYVEKFLASDPSLTGYHV